MLCASCAHPPSQNPPCGFPATGSTGCTHEVAVKPSDEVPIRQKVVQTKVASEDRTSAGDAADSSAVGSGPIDALLRAVPRQALDGNGVTQNTG